MVQLDLLDLGLPRMAAPRTYVELAQLAESAGCHVMAKRLRQSAELAKLREHTENS